MKSSHFSRSNPKRKRIIGLTVIGFIVIAVYFLSLQLIFTQEEPIVNIDINPTESNPEKVVYLEKIVYVDKECSKEKVEERPETSVTTQNLRELEPIKTTEEKKTEIGSIAVIIFAYNRPDYLERTLKSIFSIAPSYVSVIVSQDATNEGVAKVARDFPRVVHIQNLYRTTPKKDAPHEPDGYYYLASHYKFGLSTAFEKLHYDNVIILEDDMEIAPDFFDYFESMIPLMNQDPSILSVSAWNDNGRTGLVSDPEAVYRSDLAPGLGWMITKEIWNEIGPKWPKAYWDDWIRLGAQRKGRSCIRPEISRTYTFGSQGTSAGQFYDQYLKNIKLNDQKVDWKSKDLSYLLKDRYDQDLKKRIEKATKVSSIESISSTPSDEEFVYYYRDQEFGSLAARLGIMGDEKDGIRRTAYNGVISLRKNDHLLMLVKEEK